MLTALSGCHFIYPDLLQKVHSVLLEDPDYKNDTTPLVARILHKVVEENTDFDRYVRASLLHYARDPFIAQLNVYWKDNVTITVSTSARPNRPRLVTA
jgi:hypothetical protein